MRSIFVIISLLYCSYVIAQNTYLGAYAYTGKVLAHTGDIQYVVDEGITAFDIQLQWQGTGEKEWQQLYRFPKYGVGLYSTSLGNKKYYGNAYAIYSFFNFQFTHERRRVIPAFQLGLGVSYHDRIYDIHNNILNVAIGSRLNALVKIGLIADYKFSERIAIQLGTYFIHTSNGKINTPNLGINMLNASGGVAYRLNTSYKGFERDSLRTFKAYNSFEISLSTGLKTPSKFNYKQYPIASVVIDFSRRVSLKRAYGIGLDLFYDRSIEQAVKDRGFEYKGTAQLYRVGIHGFQDLFIGDLVITLNLGTYLYSSYFEFTNIFTRVGLKYFFSTHWYAKMCLKAHYGNADMIEWGVGFRW
jgi:hypothetical protein